MKVTQRKPKFVRGNTMKNLTPFFHFLTDAKRNCVQGRGEVHGLCKEGGTLVVGGNNTEQNKNPITKKIDLSTLLQLLEPEVNFLSLGQRAQCVP